MKTLIATKITRPAIENEIKSGNVFASYWSAVDFIAPNLSKEVLGKHHRIRLQWSENSKEIWEFTDATLMLYPNPKENPDRYILTYNLVQRICE